MIEGNPRHPWRERNPLAQTPTRIRERTRVHVAKPGESPGEMEVDLKTGHEAFGKIRRLWRQTLAGTPAPPPVEVSKLPAIFTRAIRYRAQSVYRPAGSKNSRLSMLHTSVRMATREPHPTLSAGTRRGRPTVRNRMTSFGSRVTPLNRRAPAAQVEKS